MDDIDRRILADLQEDGRLTVTELADRVRLTPAPCHRRLRELERNGVITGFHARVAAETIGLELLAFVLVAWSDPKVEPRFIEKIRKSASVLECHHITGAWNYLLKVRVRNTRELEAFLADTVKAVSGVQRTDTMIALSSAKETWAVRAPEASDA